MIEYYQDTAVMASVAKTRDIRESNIKRILLEIREKKRIVKSSLARSLHLSFATVSSMCSNLEERGYISSREVRESTGGRRPVSMQFNPSARYTLAIHINHDFKTHVALLDMNHDTTEKPFTAVKQDY